MEIQFFKSNKVSWKQGVRLYPTRWRSCEQWGWPAIQEGKRLAWYCDFWVFTICWRHWGILWHFYPKRFRKGWGVLNLDSNEPKENYMGDDIIIEYVKQRLEYMLFMAEAYWAHEVVWGIPCGPTLSMVYPTHFMSFEEVFGGE